MAQLTRIPRVGYVFSFPLSTGAHYWEACRQGLRELGWVEGRTILLEPRWADGHHERLPALVDDLLRAKVDVLVTAATPASLAARTATSSVPIVIVAVAEPVKVGLVASLARPGGNVTGLTLLTPDLSGKRLELLHEVVRLTRAAVVINPDNDSHAVFLEETRVAAQRLGIELHRLDARDAAALEPAFDDAVARRAGGVIVFDDPVLWTHRGRIVTLAATRRVPTMYGYREFVDAGGLISYGPSRPDLYRRTAFYVDRILKGASPAILPVEQPTKFELVVNLKTATSLGLRVPAPLLHRADQVLE